MVNTIAIGSLTLPDLIEKQQLQLTDDPQFFPEWRLPLPDLGEDEKQFLDRVQQDYFDQTRQGRVSEGLVKLVVVSPLLHLAGFYRIPFEVHLEESVQIEWSEAGEIWRGRIDALVVQDQFWMLVIESKGSALGIDQAIPQALGYMFTNPHPELPTYGFVTNGSSYGFIKLVQQPRPQYGVSDIMLLLPGRNCLYGVLAILKQIGSQLRKSV
ncbi:hypothetical protein BST81_20330 [Leptolyngbya sp. 'hensonii']|uniref:hypothetical protein n=1 Tax=Leptolyngbya sp. 'hensonii' TaxID=1922337 RepID=UPI00094F9847|nr:hypothetical protein [Leptolyngbya sp. 'hensonii']OLP16549.1 hypothetical protein BST81_20330 [Leptolyngbya sp. 'hensonii']